MAPCSICAEHEHKYTCPRCKALTCSAACAKEHKSATGCSGERDKAAYVPMNEYTWGKLMDDYTFLEDMGRKVSDWGSEIVRKGYLSQQSALERGRGRGHGRGGASQRKTAATRADGRRAYLRTQLDLRDIEIELLPDGMARRKLNQGFWDSRLKTAMLTLELVLHAPRDTLTLATNPPPPMTLLTHRNDFSRTLAEITRSAVKEQHTKRKGKNAFPEWTSALVEEDAETLYLIPQSDIGPTGKTTAFRKLDPTIKLSKALKNASFVEFPTIHVWNADAFDGPLVDEPATLVRDGQPPMKRRKLDAAKGKSNMLALVGDYDSDEDEDEEAEEDEADAFDIGANSDDGEDIEDPTLPDDDQGDGEEEELSNEAMLAAAAALLAQRQQEEEGLEDLEDDSDNLLSNDDFRIGRKRPRE